VITADDITPLLADYLPRQRWFAGEVATDVEVLSIETVVEGEPTLIWVLLDVDGAMYQLPIGGRTDKGAEILEGKHRVTLGEVDGVVLYDALFDPDLALEILRVVAPAEEVDVARPLPVEQSNSSVVYDERLILKLFRRIHDEPNPDVEINQILCDAEFPHVVPQLGVLERDGRHLAVVRQYLLEATDGWLLAQTSLRDLFAARLAPEECGADFAPEARRIGEVTALLHLAMADAFGAEPGKAAEWVAGFRSQLDRTGGDFDKTEVAALWDRVSSVADAGSAVRVHGDLHLGQVLQADSGWYVIDFEGEPDRPVHERVRPSSPLRDVAGMLRSFHYAARSAMLERFVEVDDELERLSEAWEHRASEAFCAGYHGVEGIERLLPRSQADRDAIIAAFELDKAVYEVGYELAHRPDWVAIPLAAIERTLVRAHTPHEATP
jgi:maltokinase